MRMFFAAAMAVAVGALGALAQQNNGQPPQAQETKKIRLEGHVLSTTGEPLRRATVRLQPGNISAGGGAVFLAIAPNGQAPATYSETTDDAGKFVFEDVAEGRYVVLAERTGYVSQRYGAASPNAPGATLSVKPGDTLENLDIRLIPQAVIGGRVTDREGEAMQGVQVRAMRYEYQGGQKQLRAVNAATTDDQGMFRIASLPPGRYYLVADTQAQPVGLAGGATLMAALGPLGPAQPGREQGQRDMLVPTYFPNSLDVRGAASVDVTAGAEVLGQNIQMRREKAYSIRGAVANQVTNGPAAGALITVFPAGAEANGINNFAGSARAGQDGSFAVHNLLPGAYIVRGTAGGAVQIVTTAGGRQMDFVMAARVAPGGPAAAPPVQSNASGQTEVTVGDADLENVGLLLTAGGEIPGTIRAESGELKDLTMQPAQMEGPAGGPPLPIIGGITVRLIATEGISVNLPSARADERGVFRLEGVQPGKYNVSVTGLGQGVYIKSMRFGGQDITKTPLDLSAGGSGSLDIVLAKGSGDISGTITNRDGEPVQGVSVSLWAKVPNLSAPNAGVRTVATDQNGAFRFGGLQPDEYYVAAWEELPDPGLGQHIPFLTRFTAEAASVKLEADGKPSVSGKVIGRERIQAEIANLP